VTSERGRLRVNLKTFLEDYVRGASEHELRKKYGLDKSQTARIEGILRKKGFLTDRQEAEREENLRIRFGDPDKVPVTETYRTGEVELDSGLVLHCPSCGASVRRGSEVCEYCSSHLDFSLRGKTILCPHCFAKTNAEGRFCILCARPIKGLVAEGKVLEDRLCPRCGIAMRGKTLGEFSVVECSECTGIFVPHETFEMIQERRDGVIRDTRRRGRSAVEIEREIRYVRCPVCRALMNRENFARISGVIIDVCKEHGIWFDPGEIERIMDFVAKGGLTKAKEVEIEKLKAEERLMRTRNTRATEAGGYTANGFDFMDSDRGVGVFDIVRWLIRTF
jgi:Zn-finger nucleic acid-binding protein